MTKDPHLKEPAVRELLIQAYSFDDMKIVFHRWGYTIDHKIPNGNDREPTRIESKPSYDKNQERNNHQKNRAVRTKNPRENNTYMVLQLIIHHIGHRSRKIFVKSGSLVVSTQGRAISWTFANKGI